MRSLYLFPAILLATVLTACVPKPSDFKDDAASSSSSGPVLDEKQTAAAVLEALMEKDLEALAPYMHPKNGVRFTAETYVRLTADGDTPADQRLFADSIVDAFASKQSRVWGIADGSGAPINLTVEQYFSKYVWDRDYRKAEEVRWNHVQDHGSTIDNAADAYPDSQIVEYHFSGFEPQYGGLDWTSLRLVLKQDPKTQTWYLVGVIHDHWTP